MLPAGNVGRSRLPGVSREAGITSTFARFTDRVTTLSMILVPACAQVAGQHVEHKVAVFLARLQRLSRTPEDILEQISARAPARSCQLTVRLSHAGSSLFSTTSTLGPTLS